MGNGIGERKGSTGIHMCDGPEDPGHHIGSYFIIVVQIGKRSDLRCIPVQGEARRPNSEGQRLLNRQVHQEVGTWTWYPVQSGYNSASVPSG